ncbi:MAG: O-methyltransferase [Gaiellaceae bacterium]
MSGFVNPEVEAYAEAHTEPPDDVLARLAEETRERTEIPQMMVGPVEGRFLGFLVRALRAKRVLEVGTFTGYSSISMARALPPDGKVTSVDVNAETTDIARRYAAEAGVADLIDYRVGPGREVLAELDGAFDLVFIDADKDGYVDYYEAALPLLADEGLIVADNVLWSGRVVTEPDDDSTRAIQRFNEHVQGDDRVETVMLTVRDGMTLVRKR